MPLLKLLRFVTSLPRRDFLVFRNVRAKFFLSAPSFGQKELDCAPPFEVCIASSMRNSQLRPLLQIRRACNIWQRSCVGPRMRYIFWGIGAAATGKGYILQG